MINSIKRKLESIVEGNITELTKPTPNLSIREWFLQNKPSDPVAKDIKPDITFEQVYSILGKEDFYEFIGVRDSFIREIIFEGLAKCYDVDYNEIYNKWLNRVDTLEGFKMEKMNIKKLNEELQKLLEENIPVKYKVEEWQLDDSDGTPKLVAKIVSESDSAPELLIAEPHRGSTEYLNIYAIDAAGNKIDTDVDEIIEFEFPSDELRSKLN